MGLTRAVTLGSLDYEIFPDWKWSNVGGSKGLGTSPFTVCTKPLFMYTVSDGQAGDGIRPSEQLP